MPIDRFGRPIFLGYSETETLWLEAANRLPPYDRLQAFEDIAGMTGRSVPNLREKANKMRQEKTMEDWVLRNAMAGAQTVIIRKSGPVPMAASKLRGPTPAQLRAGR